MIKKILKHQFVAGSLIMLIGSNFYNLSQFIYHFLAGRFLTKAEYGELAAVISLLGLLSIIQLSLNLTITKFISSEKDNEKVADFIHWIFNWSLKLSLVFAALTLLLSPLIVSFLNIEHLNIVLTLGPILVFTITLVTLRSILQGLLKFNQYVYSLLTEATFKLIATLLFFLLGWATFGAMVGFLLGVAFSFVITLIPLFPYLKRKIKDKPKALPFIKYSQITFIQGLAMTSFNSSDILLVKHFFNSDQAGLYAAMSVLGKVVFFASIPIAAVMFPLVSKRHALNLKYKNIFIMSTLALLIICLPIILLYFYFPQIPITTLFKKDYLEGAHLLWIFGIFNGFLALTTLLVQFYLSIGKVLPVYLFLVTSLMQIILIWFIHPSLEAVIEISILTLLLLLLPLSVYFLIRKG